MNEIPATVSLRRPVIEPEVRWKTLAGGSGGEGGGFIFCPSAALIWGVEATISDVNAV